MIAITLYLLGAATTYESCLGITKGVEELDLESRKKAACWVAIFWPIIVLFSYGIRIMNFIFRKKDV